MEENKPSYTAEQNNTAPGVGANTVSPGVGAGAISYGVGANTTAYGVVEKKPETEQTKKLRENFGFFAPFTLLYAAFYAFCMYKNASGITYPFFMAGSLIYMCVCFGKLTITLKKGSIFYMISIMLLAISTFCTDSSVMIGLNKTGIFLLIMSFILRQYYDTKKWKIGKFFTAICETFIVALGDIADPFIHAFGYFKTKKNKNMERSLLVLLGVVITLPIAAIILLLLGSADVVFRNILTEFTADINISDGVSIFFIVVFFFFGTYVLTAHLCKHTLNEEVSDRRKWQPVIGIVLNGMLSMIYVLFCGIQVMYLFMGNMVLPEGYTYAEYAREGFFELLTVGILNFIIVLVTMALFRNNGVLKGLLTIMSICTLIMIVSSTTRMIMYIRYYYMTFTRVLVLWTLLVLFLLFLGVIVSIYSEKFNLFHYCTVVVTIFYITLSFARPDYLIAKINVSALSQKENQTESQTDGFFLGEGNVDMNYLIRLSADAVPVIAPVIADMEGDTTSLVKTWKRNLQGVGNYYDSYINYRTTRAMNVKEVNRLKATDFRTFNLSRARADRTLSEYGFQ